MVTTMPHTSRRRLLPAAALVLALATPVGAQQEAEFDSWRVPGWSVTPGLSFGVVRDNNVALSAASETSPPEADSLFAIEPFGSLEYNSPRTSFSGGYSGYMRRYAEVPELNGFDHRLHVSYRHHATRRLVIFVRDSYLDVPTTDEVELSGVPFIRMGARTNFFQSGIEARLTKFTDLVVRYDLTWADFENKGTLLTGGWVNGVNTTLTRRLNARTSLGAEYSFRFADLNEGLRFMTFHDAGGVVSYELGPHTTFSASAGVSHLADQLLDETRTAPYFRTSLVHRLATAIIGASYERSFVPSFNLGGSNESQEVRGSVHMPIPTNRMYVQGMVAWRRSEPFLSAALELDSVVTRATIGYALARWFRVEGYHAFTRQDSEVTGGEINRHRIGAQMVISRPMRIH